MRNAVASLFVISLISSPLAAGQARSGGTAGKPVIKACSLLPKDLVIKASGAMNKAVFDMPLREEPAGAGSACNWSNITLQIDALSADAIDRAVKQNERGAGSKRGANYVPVSGVGDRAYYNADTYFAELMGYAGGHTFTIQIGVAPQSTAEKMKPDVIAIAQAIVAKLK